MMDFNKTYFSDKKNRTNLIIDMFLRLDERRRYWKLFWKIKLGQEETEIPLKETSHSWVRMYREFVLYNIFPLHNERNNMKTQSKKCQRKAQ